MRNKIYISNVSARLAITTGKLRSGRTPMNRQVEKRMEVATGQATRRGLAHSLLQWAAEEYPSDRARQILEIALRTGDARQLQHVIDAGLAPLLYHATRDTLEVVPGAWREVLKSAELTARFTHGALRDAANQVIDTCRDLGVPVTLLKGISISEQYYPAQHLRPMGDIDVLVSERDYPLVESTLLSLGYTPMADFSMGEGEPHGAPLLDPRRHVWIEIHTALFHKDARVHGNSLFGPANLARRSVASTFHGRSVLRLADELQLVYIASYWLRDLPRHRINPTLLIPLVDAVYLLNASAQSLDWNGLLDSLDNEMAIASLYLLLAQVMRYGFEERISPILARLAAGQGIVGAAELRIMNFLLDFCLVGGKQFMGSFGARHPMIESTVVDTLLTSNPFARKLLSLPWNLLFPPSVEDRYTVGYHAGRIARLVRGKRARG